MEEELFECCKCGAEFEDPDGDRDEGLCQECLEEQWRREGEDDERQFWIAKGLA